jgi:hypothetical protein
MKFVDIHNQILQRGFTALSNPLEDLLLESLPDSCYRAWRYIWRLTVGWNETRKIVSVRSIAKGANVTASSVSRSLHFLHLIRLIVYEPGENSRSYVTILPYGLPEGQPLEDLRFYVWAMAAVEKAEADLRRLDKNFSFKIADFCERVKAVAAMYLSGKLDNSAFDAALDLEPLRQALRKTVSAPETLLPQIAKTVSALKRSVSAADTY